MGTCLDIEFYNIGNVCNNSSGGGGWTDVHLRFNFNGYTSINIYKMKSEVIIVLLVRYVYFLIYELATFSVKPQRCEKLIVYQYRGGLSLCVFIYG